MTVVSGPEEQFTVVIKAKTLHVMLAVCAFNS